MKRREGIGAGMLTACLLSCAAGAATYYVDDDAGPGGDGLSWGAAFDDLQDALYAAAAEGDEVWVAEGLYIPSRKIGSDDPRAVTFYVEYSGVKIYGGFPNGGGDWNDRDPDLHRTILSGDVLQDDGDEGPGLPSKLENAYHVVRFTSDLASTTLLDGFEITDGYGFNTIPGGDGRSGCGVLMAGPTAPQIANCRIYDNHTAVGFAMGGGVEVGNNSEPTFTDCDILDNSAERGGGVYCDRSFATFDNCSITANTAPSGGGIRCAEASPGDIGTITLNECIISGNFGAGLSVSDNFTITMTGGEVSGNTSEGAAGIYCECGGTIDGVLIQGNQALGALGGGVYLGGSECDITIKNCVVADNVAWVDLPYTGISGGGIVCTGGAQPTILNCEILNNSAISVQSGSEGGGVVVWTQSDHLTIKDSLIEGNEADEGGGILNDGQLTLVRCTIRQNKARAGGGLYNRSGSASVTSSDFVENTGPDGETIFGGGIRNRTDLSLHRCRLLSNFGHYGGGIYNDGDNGSTVVSSSIFAGNYVWDDGTWTGYGGALLHSGDADLRLENCVLNANHADRNGGAACLWSGEIEIVNSILYDNTDGSGAAGEINEDGGVAYVRYSTVQGGWPGTGNLDSPPGYRDEFGPDALPGTVDDDYHLWLGDACNDAGDNAEVTMTTDMDGAPRRSDDPTVGDTGNGSPPVVDMGAYEVADCNDNGVEDDIDIANNPDLDQNDNGIIDDCEPECVGDIDGDDDTDQSDLGELLAAYGSCAGDPHYNPDADLDDNGCVGQSDLGILLGDWGCGT